MRMNAHRRKYTVPALLLSMTLLCGCAAPAATAAQPTASPAAPTAAPDSPPPVQIAEETAQSAPVGEKNGMYELLTQVFDSYHPGTAGSSLRAAYLAASMVDWAAEHGLDAAISGALAWDRGPETEYGEHFQEKLEAIREAALNLARGGTEILRDCGYEGEWEHSEQEVAETFDALLGALPQETGEETAAGDCPVILYTETERESYYGSRQEDTLILNYACTRPWVSIPGNESAEEAVNGALERSWRDFILGPEEPEEGVTAGRDNFLRAAEEDLEMRIQDGYGDSFAPYDYERSLDLGRGDGRVLSLMVMDTSYMGGAHGYTLRTGMSFDVRSGAELRLEDLGEKEDFLSTLEELLFQVAESAEYGAYAYWENYREILPTLLREDNWYLSREGLVVLANPYEMDSYAAGLIEFTIPYAWLAGEMKAEYLPAELPGEGSLEGEILPAAGESSYTLDDGTQGAGAAVCFTARGLVRDLSIRRVKYYEYSNTFWPEELLWHADALRSGESLTILTWIPDAAPNLAISYEGERGEESFYISQSGKDGSLVLLPESDFPRWPLEISAQLPFACDLDGDGEKETVDLKSSGPNASHWELLVDGVSVPTGSYAMDGGLVKLWLTDLDYDGVAEIFFTGDMGSDDYVTCGWRGDDLQPISFAGDTRMDRNGEKSDTADGELCFSLGMPILRSWIYQMGTYDAFRRYTMEDGLMIPAAYSEWVYRSNRYVLETVRDLPVLWDSGEPGTLGAGSRLILRSSDGGNTRFATEEGRGGVISLEYRREGMDSGWFISDISENQYFAVLPYAG